MRVKLIVKGTPAEVIEAASRHGMVLVESRITGVRNPPHREEVVCEVEADAATLAAWFREPPLLPPYPPGTLLVWREQHEHVEVSHG